LAIKTVANIEHAKHLILMGFENRSVASTMTNATSSRSHCIFSMYVTKRVRNDRGKVKLRTKAKVNLIDLAGSERLNKTGAAGARLNETIVINQSLAALGKVISALAKRQKFVPYRSSVLTLLLRESLGGNSKTVMLCAISPADDNAEETWSTLRCATQVKEIKNVVTRIDSEEPSVVIAQLKKNMNELEAQMLASKDAPAIENNVSMAVASDELKHLQAEIDRVEKSHEQRSQLFE